MANNRLDHWHGNLLTLQRRNCVLLVHDQTRFPLFLKGLVKSDFANFNGHFAGTFMNTLLKLGANQLQLDTAAALISNCQFDSKCNRSVQGTMNRMAGDVEHMLWYDNAKLDELNSYKTGAWLASGVCGVKGKKDYIRPQKEMLALLSQVPRSPIIH